METNENQNVTDSVSQSNQTPEPKVEPKDSGNQNPNDSAVKKEESAEKKYDQSYIDDLLAKQKEATDAAVAEALKVAKMDEAAKKDYEKQKTEEALQKREEELKKRELKADAKELLHKNDVPTEFLDLLLGGSIKETEDNIVSFKKTFDLAVQAQVEKRLSGKTPRNGNGSGVKDAAGDMALEIEKYMN